MIRQLLQLLTGTVAGQVTDMLSHQQANLLTQTVNSATGQVSGNEISGNEIQIAGVITVEVCIIHLARGDHLASAIKKV